MSVHRLTALLLGAFALTLSPALLADDAPPPSTAAPSPAVAEAVAKVQAFYDRSQTFSSDFEQRFLVKAHNVTKTSHGHVVFSKPGKMDWAYTDPKDNRVTSDGTTLKVYEAANKQMYEQTVDKSQYPAALSFLTGTGKLADAFSFELSAGESMGFPGGIVLTGTPKTAVPTYSKVLFYVDKQTNQVRRVLIIDGQGNRNRFDFQNAHVNEPVDPARFHLVPPSDTTVVRP